MDQDREALDKGQEYAALMGLAGGQAYHSRLDEFMFPITYDLCFGCVCLGYLKMSERGHFLRRCREYSSAMLFVESYSDRGDDLDKTTGYTAMDLTYLLGVFDATFGKGLVKHEKMTFDAPEADYSMVLVYVAPARQLLQPGPFPQISQAQGGVGPTTPV